MRSRLNGPSWPLLVKRSSTGPSDAEPKDGGKADGKTDRTQYISASLGPVVMLLTISSLTCRCGGGCDVARSWSAWLRRHVTG